jgi:hypothetical protein
MQEKQAVIEQYFLHGAYSWAYWGQMQKKQAVIQQYFLHGASRPRIRELRSGI